MLKLNSDMLKSSKLETLSNLEFLSNSADFSKMSAYKSVQTRRQKKKVWRIKKISIQSNIASIFQLKDEMCWLWIFTVIFGLNHLYW